MAGKIMTFVEAHPVEVGAGVVAVGLLLYFTLASGGGSQSGASSAADAYYAAQSADAQAGDAVQVAQINAQAGTAQTGLNDTASVTENNTWASTDLAENASNNATSVSLAPFSVEAAGIGALAGAASAPPITTTTSNQSNGFGLFGIHIGGGSSTTTTVSPNPASINAVQEIEQLLNGFQAGH